MARNNTTKTDRKVILTTQEFELLRTMFAELHISQVAAAKAAGVRRGTMRLYLNGRVGTKIGIRYETAEKMYEYFVSKGVTGAGLSFLLGQDTAEGYVEELIEEARNLRAASAAAQKPEKPKRVILSGEYVLFLSKLLRGLEVNQVDVARAIGVHESSLSLYLHGRRGTNIGIHYESARRMYDYFAGRGFVLGFLLGQDTGEGDLEGMLERAQVAQMEGARAAQERAQAVQTPRTPKRVVLSEEQRLFLSRLRGGLGIRQADVAGAIGVDQGRVSYYLNRGSIPYESARRMYDYFAGRGFVLGFLLGQDTGEGDLEGMLERAQVVQEKVDAAQTTINPKRVVLSEEQRLFLSRLRGGLGIRQADVAGAIGVHDSRLSRYLHGKSIPYESARRMYDYFAGRGFVLGFLLGQDTGEGDLEGMLERAQVAQMEGARAAQGRVQAVQTPRTPKRVVLSGDRVLFLSDLLRDLGIRQADFGGAIGVGQAQVSYYLNRGSIPYESARRMYDYFAGRGFVLGFLLGQDTGEGDLEGMLERAQAAQKPERIILSREQSLFLNTMSHGLGIRQAEIAEAIGETQGAVSHYLLGRSISHESARRMYDYFTGRGVVGSSLMFLLEQSDGRRYLEAQDEVHKPNPGTIRPDDSQLKKVRHVLTEHDIGYDALAHAAGVGVEELARYLHDSHDIPNEVWTRVCDYLQEKGFVNRASLFSGMQQNLEGVVSRAAAGRKRAVPQEIRQGSARLFLTEEELRLFQGVIKDYRIIQIQLAHAAGVGQSAIAGYLGRRQVGLPVPVAERLYEFLLSVPGVESERLDFLKIRLAATGYKLT